MQLNASRLVLQAQDDIVKSIKESFTKDLLCLSNDKKQYKQLLKRLIIESLLRLEEPAVLLRCRGMERSLVESVLEEAKREYANKLKVQPPKVTVDSAVHLPPAPAFNEI